MTVALVSALLVGLDFLCGVTETKWPSINIVKDQHVHFTSIKECCFFFFICKNTDF